MALATARLNGAVHLTELGPKEAEMRITGCDLHAGQQIVAMLDTAAGEVVEMTLKHEGHSVRTLPRPVRVGISCWFNAVGCRTDGRPRNRMSDWSSRRDSGGRGRKAET